MKAVSHFVLHMQLLVIQTKSIPPPPKIDDNVVNPYGGCQHG